MALAETDATFRRLTVAGVDGEATAYLTSLGHNDCAPINRVSIYTLRWLIEILFRKLKQYLNVQQFHCTTLNGALFDLFST